MAELARLESVCTGNRTVGSNPTLSADRHKPLIARIDGLFRFHSAIHRIHTSSIERFMYPGRGMLDAAPDLHLPGPSSTLSRRTALESIAAFKNMSDRSDPYTIVLYVQCVSNPFLHGIGLTKTVEFVTLIPRGEPHA